MPDYFPQPYTLHDQIVEEESELRLYRFHGWLCSLSQDVKLRHIAAPRDLERAISYLDIKDPARARLLRGALQMMGSLLDEATELLNDGIHWPTVEAFFCPPEEGFIDTPGQWLERGQEPPSPCPAIAASNGGAVPALIAATPEAETTAEDTPVAKPTRRSSAAGLRSLGRSLRTECEFEKRRFYAIAGKHELPTDQSAAPAIRKALSELLGIPVASRKELTANQWALAASAIETEDLYWEAPKSKPKAAPQPSGAHP